MSMLNFNLLHNLPKFNKTVILVHHISLNDLTVNNILLIYIYIHKYWPIRTYIYLYIYIFISYFTFTFVEKTCKSCSNRHQITSTTLFVGRFSLIHQICEVKFTYIHNETNMF
jgi:hypothetical protein